MHQKIQLAFKKLFFIYSFFYIYLFQVCDNKVISYLKYSISDIFWDKWLIALLNCFFFVFFCHAAPSSGYRAMLHSHTKQ